MCTHTVDYSDARDVDRPVEGDGSKEGRGHFRIRGTPLRCFIRVSPADEPTCGVLHQPYLAIAY